MMEVFFGGAGCSFLSEFSVSPIYIVLYCILPKIMMEQPINKRGSVKLIEAARGYLL